ncbi:tyrosine recombinase XerC [Anaerotruncus rubiinfantis]|uniref:tyrosine recombinase XerC n=1 Tax=Anaerotruncus rubiinfantis TaxID=1720200 RepID=UPI0034A31A0D
MATIQKKVGKKGVSYKIIASCGYHADGSQVRRATTWTPRPGMSEKQLQKELTRFAVLFEEECKAAGSVTGNIKFETFAKQWFEEYAVPKLKARTIERYHQHEARTYAAIGHLRMDRITRRHIQLFVLNLGENGINEKSNGKLSPKTIKNYLSFVSTVFNYAISQGIVNDNPCRYVTLPSQVTPTQKCYTLEEAQQFLTLLQEEPIHWRTFFTLAIYGGFRRGELCGLEWKDIDFDTGVITVQRTSLYLKGKGVFTDTPKTKGSQRSLKLPDSVVDLLRRYRAIQAADRLRVGDQWIDSDRLFVGWNGKPLNPNSVQGWLYEFFDRTGMRKVNIHSFRHLNATLLINSGADIKTVSSALGHSQTSTTLNIYAHSFAAAQAKATDAVADILENPIKGVSTK